MTAALKNFSRWLLQFAAGFVIVLALLVGVARLLLPEVASFSADIRSAVRNATGFELDFELLSAGMSVYGPELRMTVADISWPDRTELLRAEQIAISLDMVELITTRRVLPKRILLRGTEAQFEITSEGELVIQGRPLADFRLSDKPFDSDTLPNLRLHFEDIRFNYADQRFERPPLDGIVNELIAELREGRIELAGDIEPGKLLGKKLDVRGELPVALFFAAKDVAEDMSWNLWLSAQDYRLDAWLELFQAEDLPIINSQGSAAAEFTFVGMRLVELQTELDLIDIELPRVDGSPALIDAIEGQVDWQMTDTGWRAQARGLRLERAGESWPQSQVELTFSETAEEQQVVTASADFIRADDLMPFVVAIGSEELRQQGLEGELSGDIRDLSISLTRVGDKLSQFQVAGDFQEFGYLSAGQGIDIRGLTGSVAGDETGGSLELDSRNSSFRLDRLFRDTLEIERLDGLAIWRAGSDGYRVLANSIDVITPDGQGEASIELTTDTEFGEPVIDLRATVTMTDISNASRYFPATLPPKVLDWLGTAIRGGSVPNATVTLRGPLKAFPFEKGNGEFVIVVDFRDSTLAYAPDWPLVTEASGRLVFSGPSLYSTQNQARVAGIDVENVVARIPNLRTGVVTIESSAQTELSKVLGFLKNSPLSEKLGPILNDIRVNGPADGQVSLRLPIRRMKDWKLNGYLDTTKASLGLEGVDFGFTNLRGRAEIDNTRIRMVDATARILNAPVKLSVQPVESVSGAEPTNAHRAEVTGNFQVDNVTEQFSLPLRQYYSGATDAVVTALLIPRSGDSAEPVSLRIQSDLIGVASELPYPLNKDEASADALDMQVLFPQKGVIGLNGTLERGLNWVLEMQSTPTGWDIRRGAVNRGAATAELPEQPGLVMSGYVDTLRLDDWVKLDSGAGAIKTDTVAEPASTPASVSTWQDAFQSADLQIDELFAVGFRFADLDIRAGFGPDKWDIDVSGPWAQGKIRLPYHFTAQTQVELDMERLLLIEPEQAESSSQAEKSVTDPRSLPAIRARVENFAIGNFRLGELDADLVRVPDGLKSRLLTTTSATFGTESSADWLVVDNAQRSRLNIALRSQDVAETLRQLGYANYLSGKSAAVNASMLWEGGPGMGLVYSSTGQVDFDIRDGRVNELDAGGGRIIGLLSLAYLPRRLALDFTDITAGGLEYSELQGRFRLDFGNAWTCNTGLISEVADIAIVGRTGMQTEDYDQLAVVRPHVTSMLPLPAAFLGGPTVGVATLLISQLFKKSLSGIGETYYSVEGSWNEPDINEVQRADIDIASFADCEQQLPTLSPEEITALEELLSGSLETAEQDPPVNPESPDPPPIAPEPATN